MLRLSLQPGALSLKQLRRAWQEPVRLDFSDETQAAVTAAQQTIAKIVSSGALVYGVNTGFGMLAKTRIKAHELDRLQRNLVLSHSAGVGVALADDIVRLILVLKIASLARGYSGVAWSTIKALQALLEQDAYPVIPAQGSVGASGDLAPLAHMAAALLGEGSIRIRGQELPAAEALSRLGIHPLELGPKEGLALLNGTQVSTALALAALFRAEDAFAGGLLAGAMSVDAAQGSDTPFDARIHAVRGQPGQIAVATALRELLAGSEIRASHLACDRIQDPYCLRCQPQVMGACLDLLFDAATKLAIEANAVSDNPLVFAAQGDVLSGGNFHAEPVALAADVLALALAEIGNISERRTALLVDPNLSGLPAFLVENSGLNSGFMIAQVSAAALASENKQQAHPASCDTIPTSANQEDHVSMATHGARRTLGMAENVCAIVAIETLAAAQGIEFHRPKRSSGQIEAMMSSLRAVVPAYGNDRFFAPDIAAALAWVRAGVPYRELAELLPSAAGG